MAPSQCSCTGTARWTSSIRSVCIQQERFYDEVQLAKQHRFQFLPFGAGPRMCLGAGFAQVLSYSLSCADILVPHSSAPSSCSWARDHACASARPSHSAHSNKLTGIVTAARRQNILVGCGKTATCGMQF